MSFFDDTWEEEIRIHNRINLICMVLSILALIGLFTVLRKNEIRNAERAAYYASLQQEYDQNHSSQPHPRPSTPTQTTEATDPSTPEDPTTIPSEPQQSTAPAETTTPTAPPETTVPPTTQPNQGILLESSVYQKLKRGEAIQILVVGDGIAGGVGIRKETDVWTQVLVSQLKKTYRSEITLTNATLERAGSYGAYVRAMEQDVDDVDLVLLCCGNWDSKDTLGIRYEAILRAMYEQHPNCSILPILEHALAGNDAKLQPIQALAKHYSLPIADLTTPFGQDGSLLQSDDAYPNEAGHKLYAKVIGEQIDKLVKADTALTTCPSNPLNQEALQFRNFEYISADQVKRTGNAFRLNIQFEGTLGLDYTNIVGKNSTKILADGKLVDTKSSTHKSQQPLRRISIVDDVDVKQYIEIVFTRKEEADAFGGIILNHSK